MAGNLLTIQNQFYAQLPISFVPDDLDERYMKLLGDKRKLYASAIDYLNSTMLDITFPSASVETIQNPQNLHRKEIKYKVVKNAYDLFEKEITLTFNNVDSNLNYMMFLELWFKHYLNTDSPYDEPLIITMVDQNRRALYNIQYRDVMWTYIGENKLAFNDQAISQKTFQMKFTFNFMDIQFSESGGNSIDIISGNSYGGKLDPNYGRDLPDQN